MSALLNAELLKLRTTRAWIGYVSALVLVSGLGAAGTVGTANEPDFGQDYFQRDVLVTALFGGFIALLVGVATVTAEWRHGTITRTFLVTPRRERVLFAKQTALVILGALLAVLALAVTLAVAVVWLAFESSSFVFDGEVAGLIGRIVLAAALWGALGVGVGAVIQSQTPALVIAILWVVVAEALIQSLLGLIDLETVADYLPGQALGALEEGVEDGLRPWVGGAVGLAWVLAFGALGYVRMTRRDVT
jgi:ABC-2 type transport system permease protein